MKVQVASCWICERFQSSCSAARVVAHQVYKMFKNGIVTPGSPRHDEIHACPLVCYGHKHRVV